MHLAKTFIQSNIQAIRFFVSVCVFPGNWTHNLFHYSCNALPLSHRNRSKLNVLPFLIVYVKRWADEYWSLLTLCVWYKETTLCDYVNKLVNLTSSMKETVQKYQFTGGEKLSDFPIDWRSGLQIILLEIMFSLLHRPIVSLHKTSIYCQEPWIIIVCCLYTLFWLIKWQWPLTCILWITRTTVSAKNLYCSTEENKSNLGWPEGEYINSRFSFFSELSL